MQIQMNIAGFRPPNLLLLIAGLLFAFSPVAVAHSEENESQAELDRLVEKEAHNYGEHGGSQKLLPPLKITVHAARPATDVAAQIDAILDRRLEAAKIPASPATTDAEFLRRISVDITGVIPTEAKVRGFIASKDSSKREKLIAELLADPQYGQNFAHYWHDLLVKRDLDNNQQIRAQDVFVKWLTRRFNANRPWNEIVHSMLTASGDQALAGETFFILANSENGQPAANKIVGTSSALFLGNQMMCAECHVHPNTSAWNQSDFWGLAAFFGTTKAVRANQNPKSTTDIAHIVEEPLSKAKAVTTNASTLANGSIPIPDPRNEGVFVGAAKAKTLDGPVAQPKDVSRQTAADWFTSSDNPYFARAAVNRVWAQFLGRGFIAPLDDIRPTSVASHPEALDLLAEEFVASKFDQKHLIAIICSTRAYQRSSITLSDNQHDSELFSHMAMKVLTPRSLFLSLAIATSNQVDVPPEQKPLDKRAKEEAGAQTLQFFDAREYDESPGEFAYGVPQLLNLMNSKLPPACDAVAQSSMKLGSKEKIIEHLYLAALSRQPTPAEMKKMVAFVAKQRNSVKGYSALMWALLNSAEFVNNH